MLRSRRRWLAWGALGTLAEVAAVLGLRIAVEPMPAAQRSAVSEPLRTGRVKRATAPTAAAMRQPKRRAAA